MISSPLRFRSGKTIRNRIVKSAMSEALADSHNNPTDSLVRLYRRWGEGGAGLLITGNTPVDRDHLEHAGNMVLDDHSDPDAFQQLATAGKAGGARFLVQLGHSGRQTPAVINPKPLSLSDRALALPGYGTPDIATDADLLQVVEQFGRSARLAEAAGFDGVEIHAAHGYLLSSSLSPLINDRTDRWGGSPENRGRLLRDVLRQVRRVTDPEFIIAVKLNSSDFQKGGFSPDDSLEVAGMLEREGADFIEISGGNFETPVAYQHQPVRRSTAAREAYFLTYARQIKAAVSVPVMVTGGFRTVSGMKEALTNGDTDLIGMGRPFITDPDIARHLLSGNRAEAAAPERGFPPAEDLPRSAGLNWFCHQLALLGKTGSIRPDLPVIDGHQAYLDATEQRTVALLEQRRRI